LRAEGQEGGAVMTNCMERAGFFAVSTVGAEREAAERSIAYMRDHPSPAGPGWKELRAEALRSAEALLEETRSADPTKLFIVARDATDKQNAADGAMSGKLLTRLELIALLNGKPPEGVVLAQFGSPDFREFDEWEVLVERIGESRRRVHLRLVSREGQEDS
jgi:hypothetical protein